MQKKSTPKRPKAIAYVLIPPDTDVGRQMYELLYAILDEHHREISQANARVVLAWCLSWKPDVDGRLTLGKCKKASDLDRELAPYDFVVLLNRDFWQNPRVTETQRRALLDHELCHAAIAYDEKGEPKVDERGRTVYRIRKHDLEEFSELVARYGCWKRDIEAFAQALTRAERHSTGWVGVTSLQARLKTIGVDLPIDVVATWSDAERHEVQLWAMLRQDDGAKVNVALSLTLPACVTAALQAVQAERMDVPKEATCL